MNIMIKAIALAVLVAAMLTTVEAQCQTFYEGLCPGPADCMCTLGEACGTRRNISEVRTADGGCGGWCRQVVTGECGGGNDCLMDSGSCGSSSSSGSSPSPPGPPPPPGPPSPARDNIISCAQTWANEQIPYCQCNGAAECCGSCPYCGTFRCDCSGYVSYCLGLSYGYTTDTLPEVTHQISQSELLPGDILLCQGDHVVFFAGWTDDTQTNYVCYQEPGCHTSGPHYAYESIVPYPFNWNPSCFLPYRLNGLNRNQSPVSNLASKDILMRAMFNPPSYPTKYAKEALEADAKVKAHVKTLGLKIK